MQIHVWKNKWPPIDITRKYEKLCIVAFNWKFDYDDVTKWQINVMYLVENCLSYNISKLGENRWPVSEITKDIMTSSMKILMRAHVRVVTRTETWIVSMLDNGRKFMCIEFG